MDYNRMKSYCNTREIMLLLERSPDDGYRNSDPALFDGEGWYSHRDEAQILEILCHPDTVDVCPVSRGGLVNWWTFLMMKKEEQHGK